MLQISRTDADQFTAGQCIPECELIVTWEERQTPVYLRHKIILLGAKSPDNYFKLIINPDWEGTYMQCYEQYTIKCKEFEGGV